MKLFMAPGTCARVTMIALNELGLPFELSVIRFMKGEHRSPDYLRLNPKGKVPALAIDNDTVLTENVAILHYLNRTYGGLLPATEDPVEQTQQLADLCFCGSTLHPLVTRIRMPQMFAEPAMAVAVKQQGIAAMMANFALIEARLSEGAWWYGDAWSAMDGYLYWVFWRVQGADFPVEKFPNFCRHAAAMEQRESVVNALAREAEATAILEAEGLAFVPPKVDVKR